MEVDAGGKKDIRREGGKKGRIDEENLISSFLSSPLLFFSPHEASCQSSWPQDQPQSSTTRETSRPLTTVLCGLSF